MCYAPLPNHMALLLLALLIAAIYEQQGCPMDSVYGKVLKDKHQYMATIAALFRLCFLWCWCRSMGRSWVERERERERLCLSTESTEDHWPGASTAVELFKQSDHSCGAFETKWPQLWRFWNKVNTVVDIFLNKVNWAVELFEQMEHSFRAFMNKVNTTVDLFWTKWAQLGLRGSGWQWSSCCGF